MKKCENIRKIYNIREQMENEWLYSPDTSSYSYRRALYSTAYRQI